jgi:hypothetical protein
MVLLKIIGKWPFRSLQVLGVVPAAGQLGMTTLREIVVSGVI